MSGEGTLAGRYTLGRPPELTAEMAASRWRDVNLLLHSLVVLRSDLRERRTLSHLLRATRGMVRAQRALLLVRDLAAGGCRVRAELGFPKESREILSGAHLMASAAMLSRKPLLVARPDEEELGAELRLLGGGACLSVPILPGGNPWGVLQLMRDDPFQEEDAILVWIYVMVLEETLADLSDAGGAPAKAKVPDEKPDLQDLPAFHRRLDEEMERSVWSGRPLSLLRASWTPTGRGSFRKDGRSYRALRVLRRSLHPGTLISSGGEGDLLIALPGMGALEAEKAAQSLRRNLIQSRVLGEGPEVVTALRLASATFPQDGRSRQELVAAVSLDRDEAADQERS
jgi:hypothetical protein